MRRGPLLLLLLIVLMTLRGLVGPAMAAGMALPHAAVAVPAQHDQYSYAGLGEDHADHAASTPHHCHGDVPVEPFHSDAHAAAGCESGAGSHAACADCEICHTALLLPATAAASPPGQQADRVRPPAARFASASAALLIKPPIS
ncbi:MULTISPECIES: hypothetical protein [unclassified Acidovorax]|uniref:hypothetical protein n=1 Tax=unclassified Acidovorax TaxID=2684926 RepID=UPI002882FE06|nr:MULTISPECIES: hypothetical protein [unclassified Acidovorax]